MRAALLVAADQRQLVELMWTRTSPRPSSAPRPSRSTSTGGSRSPRTRTTSASFGPRSRTATASSPDPVENLFAIQEAKLKVARAGAEYLVFRGGRLTVGPLILGSAELQELRERIPTAVYTTGKHEVALRSTEFRESLGLVEAILEAQQAA